MNTKEVRKLIDELFSAELDRLHRRWTDKMEICFCQDLNGRARRVIYSFNGWIDCSDRAELIQRLSGARSVTVKHRMRQVKNLWNDSTVIASHEEPVTYLRVNGIQLA